MLNACVIGRWDRVLDPSAHEPTAQESATGFYRLTIDQETLTTDADWLYRLSVSLDGQQITEETALTGTVVQGYQIAENSTIVGGRIASSVGSMSSTQWQGDSSPPPASPEPFLIDYDGVALECDPDFLRLSVRTPDAPGESTVTLARVD